MTSPKITYGLIATLSAWLMFTPSSQADVIVHYAFNGGTFADSAGDATVTASDLAPSTAANVDDGFSTFSSPIDGGSHSYFLRGASLNVSNPSTPAAFPIADSQGNYIEFTLTSTQPLNLTSLNFDVAKNSGNPHSFRILATSNIEGHAYDNRLTITSPSGATNSLPNIIQSNIADNMSDVIQGTGTDWGIGDNTTIDLSGANYQGITSANFRIYGFTINNPTPAISNILRFDNIIVNGSVAIPEPGSLSLLLLGTATCLLIRRKRT